MKATSAYMTIGRIENVKKVLILARRSCSFQCFVAFYAFVDFLPAFLFRLIIDFAIPIGILLRCIIFGIK